MEYIWCTVQKINMHMQFICFGFVQGLSVDLTREPSTLEDLKFVLGVIADIRFMSLDVEMQYRDIQERYRTLAMYDIPVSQDETQRVESIQQKWEDLFVQAKQVDRSLVKVKKKFTIVSDIGLLICPGSYRASTCG